jgi:Lrp/AsnC family transcriptional regulator, leucine-responsive regulatory protein
MGLPSKQKNFSQISFGLPSASPLLDDTDLRIAAELRVQPRLRVAELARRVGLSSPAVADRLRHLEETGILSYRAEIDPRALGYTICAIVRISPVGGGLRLIPDIARDIPNVTECYRITGEDCYFMKVHLRSIDELEPVLDLFTPHGRTTTSIVHSSPIPPRPLPLAGSLCPRPGRPGTAGIARATAPVTACSPTASASTAGTGKARDSSRGSCCSPAGGGTGCSGATLEKPYRNRELKK